jgi:hypothetical protein
MRAGRRLLAAGVLVLMLALAPSAGAKVSTKAVTEDLPALQSVPITITAKCPSGSNVLSGGWRATAGVIGVSESARRGKRSWQITAERVTNDLTPGKLTAYAYCDTEAKRSRSASAFDEAGLGEIVTATPECTGENIEQSGGWRIENDALVIHSDLNVLSGWKTSMLSYAEPGRLTAFNYCMRLGDRGSYLRATGKQATTVRTRKCKRGDVAVAGGFRLNTDQGDNPYVNVFRREGRRWRIDADGADNDLERVRVQVVCADA